MKPCLRCPTLTDSLHGLCTGCMEAAATAERLAQGLPAKVEDPLVLDRISTVLRGRGAA